MLSSHSWPGFIRERGAVAIDVSSVVVRLALTHVAEEAGWYSCAHAGRCDCVRLTDRPAGPGPRQVLVTSATPADCQVAVDAVVSGRVCSVVLADEPETLHAVFTALDHDAILLPRRVTDLASHAPQLSDRQRSTLKLLGAGRSNQSIAAAHHQSISTAKREIAELFDIFDVDNRTSLTRSAAALGFV